MNDALARATSAGLRVTTEATVAGEGGTWAEVVDEDGAAIRLWQPRRRLGAQAVNEAGAWNFSDLHTAGTSSRAAYERAFGWEIDDLGVGTLIRVPGYGDHLAATVDPGIHDRQNAVHAPQGFADAIGWVAPLVAGEQPHWHVTFSVADRDATAQLATDAGGEVLASEDSGWTRAAVIRDPQGAVFTASQFTPPR